jgi:hypothetical protein
MILVTGDARVPARTPEIRGDGLFFAVISVRIGGIMERYGGSAASADGNPTLCRRWLNIR